MPQHENNEEVSPSRPEMFQFLITLPDGQQVIVYCTDPNPTVKHRNSMGAAWGLAYDRNSQAHLVGTIYEGEY